MDIELKGLLEEVELSGELNSDLELVGST
jgi:hypothetical protein